MSDFLSDEEQAERLRRWWSENGLALIAAVLLAVAGVLGWRWYQDWRADRAAAAADAYAAYLDARAVGEDAAALFDAIAAGHEGSVYHVFALFFEARDALAEVDLEGAEQRLRESVALADEGVLKDAARLRLARVLYELDNPAAALEQLGAVQSAGYEDDVAELMGDILYRQDSPAAAREAYQAAFDAAPAGPRREYLELKLRSVPRGDSAPQEALSEVATAAPPVETSPAAGPPVETKPPAGAEADIEDVPVPVDGTAPALGEPAPVEPAPAVEEGA